MHPEMDTAFPTFPVESERIHIPSPATLDCSLVILLGIYHPCTPEISWI